MQWCTTCICIDWNSNILKGQSVTMSSFNPIKISINYIPNIIQVYCYHQLKCRGQSYILYTKAYIMLDIMADGCAHSYSEDSALLICSFFSCCTFSYFSRATYTNSMTHYRLLPGLAHHNSTRQDLKAQLSTWHHSFPKPHWIQRQLLISLDILWDKKRFHCHWSVCTHRETQLCFSWSKTKRMNDATLGRSEANIP